MRYLSLVAALLPLMVCAPALADQNCMPLVDAQAAIKAGGGHELGIYPLPHTTTSMIYWDTDKHAQLFGMLVDPVNGCVLATQVLLLGPETPQVVQ